MIVEWQDEDRSKIRPLFDSHTRGRAVIFPALDQGRGRVWTNSIKEPKVARLQLAMINAVTGNSSISEAEEIIRMIEPMQIVFGPDDEWTRLIKTLWGERCGIQQRAVLSPASLDLDHLKQLRDQLPEGYELERLDLQTIERVDKRRAMHIPMFFGSSEEFYQNGIAYGIKYEGQLVCISSTFTPYTDMFEIQVDTHAEDHRRKGLATVASAALMICALESGIVPYWDAANEASIKLALKLGYTDIDRWEAYYLKPPE
jgi:hypothetical protein